MRVGDAEAAPMALKTVCLPGSGRVWRILVMLGKEQGDRFMEEADPGQKL